MRLLLLLLMSFMPLSADEDLESNIPNYVVETMRIDIPGYPTAFNPSIIRWKGSLLMSFRVIPDPKASFNSKIGLIWLDDDFIPLSDPQILETQTPGSSIPSRSEDARLIEVQGRLYMVYSDNKDLKISKAGFRLYIAEIRFDGKVFSLHDVVCLSRYEGESPLIREKNWVPFVLNNELYLAYSLCPHKIFRPLLDRGECETVAVSRALLDWQWGELRGGTQALPLNESEYLSFFHSWVDIPTIHSDGKAISHYFMGGYTFSREAPFEIKRISQEPIVAKGFYSGKVYKPYWKQVRAIFPCGFLMNENYIWIAYGRADYECWIIKLDKNLFLDNLKAISTQ